MEGRKSFQEPSKILLTPTSLPSPGSKVLELLRKDESFVRCLHSVGNGSATKGWPCDPKNTIILHRPSDGEIVSYGEFF